MKKRLFCFMLMLVFSALCAGQPADSRMPVVNGYARKISGVDFYYHSSIPSARESLLIRATDGNSSMEWETAPAPAVITEDFVTFVWLAGQCPLNQRDSGSGREIRPLSSSGNSREKGCNPPEKRGFRNRNENGSGERGRQGRSKQQP